MKTRQILMKTRQILTKTRQILMKTHFKELTSKFDEFDVNSSNFDVNFDQKFYQFFLRLVYLDSMTYFFDELVIDHHTMILSRILP